MSTAIGIIVSAATAYQDMGIRMIVLYSSWMDSSAVVYMFANRLESIDVPVHPMELYVRLHPGIR